MANKSRETANLVSITGISTLRTEFNFINGPVQIGSAVTITAGGIVAGLSTITNFRATHINATGVGTFTGAIVGSAVTITSGGIVAGLGTVNSINATHINATGVSTLSSAIVGSAVTITAGGIVAGLSTVNNFNATHINATGVSTLSSAIVGSAVTITAGGIVAGLSTVNNFNATHINISGVTTVAGAIVGSAVTITAGGIVAGLSTITNFNATHINISGVTTVAAGSVSAPSITPTGDSNTGIFFPAADTIAFGEGGAEAARIDSSGRLLVGTSSGSYKFQIGALGSAGFAFDDSTTVISGTFGSGGHLQLRAQVASSSGGGDIFLGGSTRGDSNVNAIVFSTANTERMKITSNLDNLCLLGQSTNPATSTLCLAVRTGSANGVNAQITSNTGTSFPWSNYNASGTYIGGISCTSTTTSFPTSSDYRLKTNVQPLNNAISLVTQLKPSTFEFAENLGETVQGFIAHELQEVVPLAVIGEKDAEDASGNPIYQGVDAAKLVPLLTAALQEAIAKIESLEARLTAAGI